jgi:anti-sigma factor RsiW
VNDTGHTRWEDDLAAYLLDALSADESREVERHLEGCPRCRERARWLQASVETLPMSVEQHEPPPELRERLMQTVRAEAAAPVPAAPGVAPAARARRGWLDILRAVPRPALALGMTLIALAAVAGYAIGTGGDGTSTSTVSAQVDPALSGAAATLERDGDSGVLRVEGLPQRPGRIYEVWLAQGEQVRPAGLFQVDRAGRGAAAIPQGLDGADRVMVSVEPPRGSAQPTTEPIVIAEI